MSARLGGLVSYDDSDEEDEQQKAPPMRPPPTIPPKPPLRVDTSKPPPGYNRPSVPLFPGVSREPNAPPAGITSSYSDLVERDDRGRIRVAAPRLDDRDDDDEDDRKSKFKKPKTMQLISTGGSGLMAILPKPEGSKKKEEKATEYDSLFQSKKRSEVSSSPTVIVPEVSAIRFQAEQKKAAMLEKYKKKKPEEIQPEVPEDPHYFHRRHYPPAGADYLGLNAGFMPDYHYPAHSSGHPGEQAGADDEEVEWEVDESAYNDSEPSSMGYAHPPRFDSGQLDPSQAEIPGPAYGLQPGAVWTANYKYDDVQQILERPQFPPAGNPRTFKTNDQVHNLIARHEGVEFQQYLNAGNAVNIVDFRADEHIGNARANVMRSLTDQSATPSRPVQVKGKVNKLARAKGQITYLAAQAVARETELQNEWAKGRQTRQMAARKYGF
ncbi:hypothetical protein RvY_04366 [Ramazzottius varieornatus]|uniref:Proline-rich protein PRCC n=1 Tax=Ramazzottius varieornatus TaxID=947166 RepID=A0A1D1UUY7_RAMVA|nr:hypothetical protein RvY_04366 [Ramazzottius varieornatus]